VASQVEGIAGNRNVCIYIILSLPRFHHIIPICTVHIISLLKSPYFINPAFPSPSASIFGFILSIKEGFLPLLSCEAVWLPVVPAVPVVPRCSLLWCPFLAISFSVKEVVPFAPAPPSVPPTARGSPPKASVRSSRPVRLPPWRLNSSIVTGGREVAL
jgi:hypothetical protein